MLYNISDQAIRSLAANKQTYERGLAYAQYKKVNNFHYSPEKGKITAEVTGSWDYDVSIDLDRTGSVRSHTCSCPAFEEYTGACKHIVAVLKTAQQKLAARPQTREESRRVSLDFMDLFTRQGQEGPKQELNLELELQVSTNRYVSAFFHLKVGLSRLYVVKSLREFLVAIKAGKPLEFGLQFTYDPDQHTFKREDQPLITMLQEMLEQYEAVSEMTGSYTSLSAFAQKPFTLSRYYLAKLLDALGNKVFAFKINSGRAIDTGNPLPIQILYKDVPLSFHMKAQEQDLALVMKNALPFQLTDDGRYYVYHEEIYRVSPEQQDFLPNLIKALPAKTNSSILFPKDQKDLFASEALPIIEKLGSVSIEPELAEKFIREDLQTKIYFDKKGEGGISARLEFHYGDILINPFSRKESHSLGATQDHILIRNIGLERKILSIFEQAEFTVSQGTIGLEDDEKIFDFTVQGLPQLQKLADIFYSDDFKIKVHLSTSLSGRVRLDESLDMLEISFQYSDIDQAELADIFQTLQMKKKYYRLKDGSFLDLKQPELEFMAQLLDYLDLDAKDLQDSVLHLPKFRAMYIDSYLRDTNLSGFQRNRAFKQLVQNILEPQDNEFDPPESLRSVLRDYQKTGFKWLKTLASYGLGGILADDMGLGKTLQVLAFLLSEKYSPLSSISASSEHLPALVIAPTSLVYNWQAEGEKFAPELDIQVIEGNPQERQEQLRLIEGKDLVVCSYAVLRRDIEEISKLKFSYCILDEAQNIKNPQTLNAKSVQRIQAKGYFVLTGTPIENSLSELWSLFHFFMPGYLLSQQEFNLKYALPITRGDAQPLIELSRQIKPFILRRLKKDVLKELPPKIETKLIASLTEEQRKIYLAYLQQTKSQIAQDLATSGFAKSQIKILAALTRLRQICSHPAMFIENYDGESGKMLLFQELLDDSLASGHRLLVFSQFTSMLDIVQNYLNTKKIEHFYLSGSTKALDRTHMAQAFNSGQGEVFLISLKAGGTGLNLTGADMVIHFDPWWNPAVEDQATDRAHRIGQNQSVQVIKLLTQGTIEEKVYALQEKKKKLIDSVIQPGETMLSKLTEQELKYLFEID